MPGKLAAARASRGATEGIAALPWRTGSTHSGLPLDLEDAAAGDTERACMRAPGARGGVRHGSTDTGLMPPPNPKPPEGNTSTQSVTFFVTSGQHALQHTPTATAAASAQGQNCGSGSPSHAGGVQPRTHSTATNPAVQPSGGSGPCSAPPGATGFSPNPSPCPSPTPSLGPGCEQLPSAGPSSHANVAQQQASWRGPSSATSLQGSQAFPQQAHRRSLLTESQRQRTGGSESVSSTGAPSPAAAAVAVDPDSIAVAVESGLPGLGADSGAAGAQPTVNAASLDAVWTAVAAPTERVRAAAAPSSIPLRHSRLRTVAPSPGMAATTPGEPATRDPDGSAPPSAPVGGGYGGDGKHRSQLMRGASESVAAGLAADSLTSQGRTSSVSTWAAAAPGVGGGRAMSTSVADSSSLGGGVTPASNTRPNSQVLSSRGKPGAPRRSGPHGTGLIGLGSELFAEAGPDALPSGESSFTVRQTPSDVEDDLYEGARTRRAMRAVTLASIGSGVVAAGRGMQGPGAPAGEDTASSPSVATVAAAAAAALARGTPEGPEADAARRMVIRLNHQPGHNRRPPNRHSSMPTMKREGVARGGGGPTGLGLPRRSPLTRPPLSGGLAPGDSVPEDGEYEDCGQVDDNPSNMSLPTALLGTDAGAGGPGGTDRVGGGGAGRGGGAGDQASTYSRVPSDSPITSQLSVTSSFMMLGPVSAAQQRYQSLTSVSIGTGGVPAGGPGPSAASAAVAAAAGIALGPAPAAAQSSSQLGLGGPPQQPVLMRVPLMGGTGVGGSSGQRLSFEEEAGGRHTPTIGGGAQSLLLVSNPHLACSTVSFAAGDRPSHVSARMLSGAHAQHSSSLAALHKAVEKLMLQDSGLYAKVQASMKGISSLAKETNKLEFTRDASGATVINQYVVVKTLGRGAFGKVKLCLNTLDGQLYAVKMINRAHLLRQLQKPSRPLRRRAPPPRNTSDTGILNMHMHRTQTDGNLSISHTNNFGNAAQAAIPARASMDDTSPLAAIMREIAVMKKVDHPNVVRLHEVIDPPGSSYLMMVMEYCEGGCVMETRAQTGLTPLGEDTAREYFRQACLGLDYLHYNNVIHGDLKPENMLVSGTGLLKIADFGSSRFMGGDPTDATKTSCTPAFQSPEEIGHQPMDPFAADLWALACCLYTFVFGRLPFVGSCVVDIYRAILTRPHTYPEDMPCSPALRDLLDRMLDKDPARRPRLREIGLHPWITAGGQLPPLQFLQSLVGSDGEAPPPVIHVTHAEQVNAIDRSSLVSLIRARLKEKTCQPGEYLFKEGEEAHCVYMIMAGVVELTQHLRRPTTLGASGGGGTHGNHHGSHSGPMGHGGHWPHANGVDGNGNCGGPGGDNTNDLHDASFSVDLDESLTLDHPEGGQLITEAMNIVDGKLHIDRQQAIEMRRRMQGNLLGENAEYVVEVKGPGSVIGEMGLDTAASATHRVSARARGPVTVVKLTEENFFKALLQMYGGGGAGGGGGSAASTTLTASSISEAASKGPGQSTAAGAASGAGTGANPAGPGAGPGGMPGMSAQHLMMMQYLEDSGSFATFPAQPASASASSGMVPGRFSMDAGVGRQMPYMQQGYPQYGNAHMHHASQLQNQPADAAAAAAANGTTNGGGAGAAGGGAAPPLRVSGTGAGGRRVSGGGGGGGGGSVAGGMRGSRAPVVAGSSMAGSLGQGLPGSLLSPGTKNSGANSLLGVLNTIHSISASRAGPTTSEEGVADL